MIVPVWFETWELGCCIGVLEPGRRIQVLPLAHELLAVSRPDDVTPEWRALGDGSVVFTAVAPGAADTSDRSPAVLDVGSLTIACRSVPRPGPLRARARLGSGSHGYVEGEAADLVAITGTVARVREVPGIYVSEDNVHTRVGFGPPRGCDRTGTGRERVSYVVDLDCP